VLKSDLDGIREKLYQKLRFKEIGYHSKEKRGDYMRIGFVGAGKVGFSLGKYFTERNLCVSGYYSQNSKSSEEAALFTNTKYYETIEEIVKDSDTLFLTVPDGAIHKVYAKIAQSEIRGKIICHCSGAMSSEVFDGIRERGAFGYSVHPIYAFSDKRKSYQEISNVYFTIEGDRERMEELINLFHCLGNKAEILDKSEKVRYHLASVFASNLVAGLYDYASDLLKSCGLSQEFSEKALIPLFLGNADAIGANGVVKALTGPVERNDVDTIKKHLASLKDDEREIYVNLSKRLIKISELKNNQRDYETLKQILTL